MQDFKTRAFRVCGMVIFLEGQRNSCRRLRGKPRSQVRRERFEERLDAKVHNMESQEGGLFWNLGVIRNSHFGFL